MGLGSAYLALGDMEQAKKFFEEGYKKVEEIHTEASLEHALASIQYASYLLQAGEKERANDMLNTARETLQAIERNESLRQENIMTLLSRID